MSASKWPGRTALSVKRQGEKLQIYVPTRGRVEHQLTLRHLPKEWRERTVLVCPASEAKAHGKAWPDLYRVVVQPDSNMSIAAKRAWIFRRNQTPPKLLMLDDDLRFAARVMTMDHNKGFGYRPVGGSIYGTWAEQQKKNPLLQQCLVVNGTPRCAKIFERIEHMLSIYSHGGIGARLMHQTYNREFTLGMRAMYALAYYVPDVLAHCKLGRIEHREDLDYTLQMFAAGFQNAVYTWAVVEQHRGFGAPGGVQLERTMKAANADAYKLAKLHPRFVRVKVQDYKVSIPRVEVRVAWQKAMSEGLNELL